MKAPVTKMPSIGATTCLFWTYDRSKLPSWVMPRARDHALIGIGMKMSGDGIRCGVGGIRGGLEFRNRYKLRDQADETRAGAVRRTVESARPCEEPRGLLLETTLLGPPVGGRYFHSSPSTSAVGAAYRTHPSVQQR